MDKPEKYQKFYSFWLKIHHWISVDMVALISPDKSADLIEMREKYSCVCRNVIMYILVSDTANGRCGTSFLPNVKDFVW